jgi:hypothetical protein
VGESIHQQVVDGISEMLHIMKNRDGLSRSIGDGVRAFALALSFH